METLRKYLPLNLDLMMNPVNWVIVTLMVLSAGLAIAFIIGQSTSPKTGT